MPRKARLDEPAVLHYIMIRGIERLKIFINDRDRQDFLDRLVFYFFTNVRFAIFGVMQVNLIWQSLLIASK